MHDRPGPFVILKPDVCGECGGKCCKSHSGMAHPNDFDNSVDQIETALASGDWSIDWWEAETIIYYLRPRHVGIDTIADPSWGGVCSLLTETGCSLEYAKRPMQCRDLTPVDSTGTRCTGSERSGKFELASEWLPYQNLLRKWLGRDVPEHVLD